MSKPTNNNLLESSKIEVGHCVIVDPVERPCSRLVAVVVQVISHDLVACKYLNASRDLDEYNRVGIGMICSVHRVTPVGTFGVDVRTVNGGYYCVRMGDSIAKYADGSTRLWQDESGIDFHPARTDVLALAKVRKD